VGKLLSAVIAVFSGKLMITVLTGVLIHSEVSLGGKLEKN
jgi:hypothetical protein